MSLLNKPTPEEQVELDAMTSAMTGLLVLVKAHHGTSAILELGIEMLLLIKQSVDEITALGGGSLEAAAKLRAEDHPKIPASIKSRQYRFLKKLFDMIPAKCFEEPQQAVQKTT